MNLLTLESRRYEYTFNVESNEGYVIELDDGYGERIRDMDKLRGFNNYNEFSPKRIKK